MSQDAPSLMEASSSDSPEVVLQTNLNFESQILNQNLNEVSSRTDFMTQQENCKTKTSIKVKDFKILYGLYNGTAMITQHFLSYLFNNWEKTLGDEFFLLPLHRGGVVDLHLKYSMKSKMGIRRRTPGYISRTPARKHPSLLFAVLSTRHNLFNPGQMFLSDPSPIIGYACQ